MGKKQYPLRLDQDLYNAIERWASDELRSVNAHIEFLLRDALKRGGRLPKRGEQAQQIDAERGKDGQ